MPSIAIIGTEACGKTVFITTLARRFTAPDKNGVFIEPRNRKTTSYVERTWKKLSECSWPPFTPQGEMQEYEWLFHAGQGLKCEVRLIDCAGHDLRRLFADEQVHKEETLPTALQNVVRYCQQAEIVLFMVNLSDFMSTEEDERRIANEWAIKYAMDFVRNSKVDRYCCLVFTQADRFDQLEREYESWDAIAKKFLPHVHSAHLHEGNTPIFPVASVADTKECSIRGKVQRVPDLNFTSQGLEGLVEWLAQSTRSIITKQEKEAEEQRRRELDKHQQEELARRQAEVLEEQRRCEQEAQHRQELREQRAAQRQRRLRQSTPLAIVTFVASLVFLYPASWSLLRYFAPEIKITKISVEEPTYTEQPVIEDHPDWVKQPKYKQVRVPDGYLFLPWTWGSGHYENQLDGEEVVQRGTKRVEVGKTKVQTGTQTLSKEIPVTVGYLPKYWFWGNLFPIFLAVVLAGAVGWREYDRLSRQQGA